MVAAILWLTPLVAEAQSLRLPHRMRPRPACGILPGDYRTPVKPTVTQASLAAQTTMKVDVGTAANSAEPENSSNNSGLEELLPTPVANRGANPDTNMSILGGQKIFQWPTSRIRNQHCSIGQVVLLISDTGDWMLTLTARQDDPPQDYSLFYDHLHRNQFALTIHLTGTNSALNSDPEMGRLVLAQLNLTPFWVERDGVEKKVFHGKTHSNIQAHFDDLQQAELVFSIQ